MANIPLYLKTDPKMARPTDPEFYLFTGDGAFLCRNHKFFESDVPAKQAPQSLAEHAPRCVIKYPKLGIAALEYIIGFFDVIFEMYQSESVILLYWDLKRKRYLLRVPKQKATVWESYSGKRSPLDVGYEIPLGVPVHQLLVGDIHCHGDIGAYASYTDKQDELHRDGVHGIVGYIDQDPPQFHQDIAIDGHRFNLKFGHIFKGYKQRRKYIPQAWIDQVEVVTEKSSWIGSSSSNKSSNTTYYGKNSWDDDEDEGGGSWK